VLPGAGAFEIAAHMELMKFKDTVKGRARLGVQAFADALLVIPKVRQRDSTMAYAAQEAGKLLLNTLQFGYMICHCTVGRLANGDYFRVSKLAISLVIITADW
jgi:chaperonin GroEL (HSP60 family)